MNNKKIYRSHSDKMLCGVCGGVGEYFQVDPTIVRLAWVVLSFMGPGLFAYIIAAIIIPEGTDEFL
ncbi:MAG: PspC domain-containing protein [Lachnospiraceae bacterium]